MALQASGIITLTNIQTEFGGSNPIGLSEYYRGGSNTTSNNTNVPTGGAISMSNFYNGTSVYTYTISSSVQEANVRSLAITSGWDGTAPLKVVINSDVYVWSNSTSNAGLLVSGSFPTGITIENSGYIIGKGGKGGTWSSPSAATGGPALVDTSGSLTISNLSGGYIAGGGGGGGAGAYSSGGGGAGGGAGGGPTANDGYGSFNGGAGGAVGQSGSNGAGVGSYFGYGGGSGGGGGTTVDRGSKKDNPSGAGGGGGRVLPGTGGVGPRNAGNGGSAGGTGSSTAGGQWHSGGGGGWGASGGAGTNGSGAAGGRAITWSSTQGTVTNNGTIYGAYT